MVVFRSILAAVALALLGLLAPVDGSDYLPPQAGNSAVITDQPIAPDGTQVMVDLPRELHLRNKGGSDKAGLCVFTSCNMAAYMQNVEPLWDFRDWMTQYPGGGYPSKVDRCIDQICREKKCAKPRYIQIESADLEPLKLALRTGRPVSITFAYSPAKRYGGAKIAHMVNLVHLDDRWACVIDNNFPGTWEWFPAAEFTRVYTGGGKTGWSVIFLDPGPPPPPIN